MYKCEKHEYRAIFLMIYSSEFVEDLCISSFVLEYEYEN